MYMPCEIVVSHYKPIHIEKGMIFGKLIMVDGELRWELWRLYFNPHDDEEFINKHGFPVEISIVDFYGEKLASEHEIGWMDDGDEYDELREATLHDINYILQQYNGECYVDCNQDKYMEEDMVIPIYVDEKVVIAYFDDSLPELEDPD